MTRPFLRAALALAPPLALSALTLGGTPAPLAAGNDDRPLRCEISARPSPLGVTLEARASSGARAEGAYSLDIAQQGAAGRTVIRQGGDFSLRAGETAVLGRVMLGHDPAGYAARMVLRAGGAEVACSAPGVNDL